MIKKQNKIKTDANTSIIVELPAVNYTTMEQHVQNDCFRYVQDNINKTLVT